MNCTDDLSAPAIPLTIVSKTLRHSTLFTTVRHRGPVLPDRPGRHPGGLSTDKAESGADFDAGAMWRAAAFGEYTAAWATAARLSRRPLPERAEP